MRIFWLILLIGFAAINVYTMMNSDFAAFVAYLRDPGPWGRVVLADLLIALTIVVVWLWRDARSRGVNPLPYAVATGLTGSIAPLVYLLRFWGEPIKLKVES